MLTKEAPKELDKVVIRFAGDSGDGMQLTGAQFTFTSALFGNDLATFPDFPAEIRAPAGTVEGVSGFQVQIGKTDIYTAGDSSDVLVAMNPAALRSNLKWARKGGMVIIDSDSFTARDIEKAGYTKNPLDDTSLSEYLVIRAPITSLTKKALEGLQIDMKSMLRCRNMFALGIMYWLFSRPIESTLKYLEQKFKNKNILIEANKKTLHAGYYYAETVEAMPSSYKVPPAVIEKGRYRHISGNTATAWGLMAAVEILGKKLYYASYPITPASDILHELSKHKYLGVITVQAEDEIAAVCSTIGAVFAGSVGVTASSGPGLALKAEAIGLAVMTELPLVIIDVQRAGPSTGMPTKTEQGDLMMAINGRNGENPLIVISPSTPSNCFNFAYEAVRLAIEHMTPVIMLSDGYIASGSEPWKFPEMSLMPKIKVPTPKINGQHYMPYFRDSDKLSRFWAVPGMAGFEHCIGGIEKEDLTGNISYNPQNHEKMVHLRQEKVERVANYLPIQKVIGNPKGNLLIVGWGSTYGALFTAYKELISEGVGVSLCHFNYLNPLPKNTDDILSNFKIILVCELNLGQFAGILRSKFPQHKYKKMNKVQGLPFTVTEIKQKVVEIIKSITTNDN